MKPARTPRVGHLVRDPVDLGKVAESTEKPVSRRRKVVVSIRRLFVVALATYLGVCVFVNLLQTRLIYFPTRAYDRTPADVGLSYENLTLNTEDGVRVAAWYVAHPRAKGSILFCHGNAGNISDRLVALQSLHQLGYNVLALDYRGYGRSEGRPGEAGTYRDAEAAWRYLVDDLSQPADRVVLFGESLGGAVVIELASRHDPGALVVESTFTSLVDIGRLHYPLLPVGWILRHRYESISRVASIRCPKLFIHARDDELIPIANARKLFAAAQDPKEFLETPGGHNTGGFSFSHEYTQRFGAFLDEALGASIGD